MNQSLDNDNLEAHYIKGLNQFFYPCKPIKGLNQLRQFAIGNYDNGIYHYDILMGNFEEGKNIWISYPTK